MSLPSAEASPRAPLPQCQVVTGLKEVSPDLDAFVATAGLASWGVDYQARV